LGPNPVPAVGSQQLVNATMETYAQPSNCFDCHAGSKGNGLGSAGGFGLSHIYGDLQPLPLKTSDAHQTRGSQADHAETEARPSSVPYLIEWEEMPPTHRCRRCNRSTSSANGKWLLFGGRTSGLHTFKAASTTSPARRQTRSPT